MLDDDYAHDASTSMIVEVFVCSPECGNAATAATVMHAELATGKNWRLRGVFCAKCDAEMRREEFDVADSLTRDRRRAALADDPRA